MESSFLDRGTLSLSGTLSFIVRNKSLLSSCSSSRINTLSFSAPFSTSFSLLFVKSLTIVVAISGVISANLISPSIFFPIFMPNPVYKSCRVLSPDS